MSSLQKDRLAKVIARAGICSRRDAEKLILAGKVTVNGQQVMTPVTLVTQADKISIEGCLINQKPSARLWAFYKPRGVITSHKDPQGRPTLFDLLPPTLPRVISVGRLDLMSEGLILLTNDGALARALELPTNRLARTYRVRIFGQLTMQQIATLRQGVTIDHVHYEPVHVTITSGENANQWLEITLTEGKNREIRKIMSWLGVKVNRLIRIQYGPIELAHLKPNEVKEMTGMVAPLQKMLKID